MWHDITIFFFCKKGSRKFLFTNPPIIYIYILIYNPFYIVIVSVINIVIIFLTFFLPIKLISIGVRRINFKFKRARNSKISSFLLSSFEFHFSFFLSISLPHLLDPPVHLPIVIVTVKSPSPLEQLTWTIGNLAYRGLLSPGCLPPNRFSPPVFTVDQRPRVVKSRLGYILAI